MGPRRRQLAVGRKEGQILGWPFLDRFSEEDEEGLDETRIGPYRTGGLCAVPPLRTKRKEEGGGLRPLGQRSFGTGKEGRKGNSFGIAKNLLAGFGRQAPHTCPSKRVLLVRGKRRKKKRNEGIGRVGQKKAGGRRKFTGWPPFGPILLLKTKQLRHPQRAEWPPSPPGWEKHWCLRSNQKKEPNTNGPTQMFSRHCQLPLAFLASGSIFANQPLPPLPSYL